MPSSVRSKDAAGGKAPMSERQQMALLMQMTSTSENLPRSPGGTSYTRHRDRNERGETPLHLAAIKGDIEQVSKLLAHRADPNVPDFAGWTPLHEACNYGWYEIAFKLVQAGANVNAKGLDNDTPLHDAAINGHVQLIKLLVERGADINAKNAKGKTPLDSAHAHVKPYLLDPDLPVSDSMVPSSRLQSRTRDEKKITDSKKSEDLMEANKSPPEDPYEFKTKESSPDQKSTENDPPATDPLNTSNQNADEGPAKRNFSEVSESTEEPSSVDDESKKKKRKDETVKEGKNTKAGPSKGQCNKQTGQGKGATANTTKATSDKKSPCPSPKVTSDAEDDSKSDLKVPPLKIVIPQTTSSETETGGPTRSSKSTQRTHQALPYVVPSSNSSDSSDKDPPLTCAATVEEGGPSTSGKSDEKKDGGTTEEQQSKGGSHQRVLRSSHRGGQAPDRSGSTSSPPLQRSHSPSPSASPSTVQTEVPVTSTSSSYTVSKASDTQATTENETTTTTVAASPAPSTPAPVVELHPRKRKMKPKEQAPPPAETTDTAEPSVHPHDQPITNCYQMFRDIRKQIEKRRKGLFPVQPKPPQGFKDYLMNRCTYVLAGTTSTTPNISFPPSLQVQMKDLFTDQEKERYRLRMQHVIEKEKLVLSVEQEILRVHGRAARALANQHLPFSVCSILRDEEVYNLITPEQEEKDRNARSRYNGRLFLSWLQDVDDKWEKIKEHMLLRHHNEAESLHAVQKMDWEWKMKELSLCDRKITPTIDDLHVPMVHVSDDFDLLPA